VIDRTALIIVDDELALCQLLGDVIADVGFNTLQVADPSAAMELARAKAVDVLIVYSVDRDRVVALAELGPVVAIADPNWRWTAADLGVRCIVPLMFDISELESAVRNCLPPPPNEPAFIPGP